MRELVLGHLITMFQLQTLYAVRFLTARVRPQSTESNEMGRWSWMENR